MEPPARRQHHQHHNLQQEGKRMMTCHSDFYKEDQPTGWPSLSRDAMPNRAWESLRAKRKVQ
jgi:hypothetical protein